MTAARLRVVQPFERLAAWRAAHALALAIYRATENFPKSETFGLISQLRRAAYSVAANIAEGYAKKGPAEFRRFLDISIGSLGEIGYALILSRDLGLLSQVEWQELDPKRNEAGKLTWLLYKSLKQ